jgi:hypothetical protein
VLILFHQMFPISLRHTSFLQLGVNSAGYGYIFVIMLPKLAQGDGSPVSIGRAPMGAPFLLTQENRPLVRPIIVLISARILPAPYPLEG